MLMFSEIKSNENTVFAIVKIGWINFIDEIVSIFFALDQKHTSSKIF